MQQTLDEMDFERGVWSASLNGDLGQVKYLIQRTADPSQPNSAGYTALLPRLFHLLNTQKFDWSKITVHVRILKAKTAHVSISRPHYDQNNTLDHSN
ncbi:Ankyrin Repeat Domain-Containing Protein 39 [Manis pentadactyla]|nr:Ankyrin Repeat Domain-Containing Protein 39 [Manis pentadactyla]